jgi:hypothetical protein
VGGIDTEAGSGLVDPVGGAFELSKVADGGFVDDAMAIAETPLGAPFLIAEGGDEADGEKDLGEGVAVGDLSFGFDAVLVGVFAGTLIGEALVGEETVAGVGADTENFSAGAHLAVGSVKEDVVFKAARSLQSEPGGLETLSEAGKIVDAEFDFGFDGHDERQLLAASF